MYLSETPDDVDLQGFYLGQHMQGLTVTMPQQWQIAKVLEAKGKFGAPLFSEVTIEATRRIAKTTTIWSVLLGRCTTRPGWKVVTTAQTGLKARERFMEIARTLEAGNPHVFGIKRILKGAGAEAIEWRNGSRLWVVPPIGDSFRGDAADDVLCDEGQAHDANASADIMSGAASLMDTRAASQLIVAGTAGSSREGMLWEGLEAGRAGRGGIVEFAAREDVNNAVEFAYDEAVKAGDREAIAEAAVDLEKHWHAVHPGLACGLTTVDKMWSRYTKLPRPQWRREYMGIWPHEIASAVIPPADWDACGIDDFAARPDRFGVGFEVEISGSCHAVVVAWRDDEGRPHGEVVAHELGTKSLAPFVLDLATRHRGMVVGYDNIGINLDIAGAISRTRGAPRLVTPGLSGMKAGVAALYTAIRAHDARHPRQPALDAAAERATRRELGESGFVWGRRNGEVTALVAWTIALRVYDTETKEIAPLALGGTKSRAHARASRPSRTLAEYRNQR